MSNPLNVTTPSDTEILITRVFNAPRPLVFQSLTDNEFLKRWLLGPPGWTMTESVSDLRVGGKFRHEWKHEAGQEMAMVGVYREVTPPVRIVRTECFEFGCASQAGEQVAVLELSDQGERTLLTLTVQYPSKEARDATIASGMERGISAGYERVDAILESLVAK